MVNQNLFYCAFIIITPTKEKRRKIPKGDFSLKPKTRTTCYRSSAVKIDPKSERDNARPSYIGRRDGDIP